MNWFAFLFFRVQMCSGKPKPVIIVAGAGRSCSHSSAGELREPGTMVRFRGRDGTWFHRFWAPHRYTRYGIWKKIKLFRHITTYHQTWDLFISFSAYESIWGDCRQRPHRKPSSIDVLGNVSWAGNRSYLIILCIYIYIWYIFIYLYMYICKWCISIYLSFFLIYLYNYICTIIYSM